MKKSKILSDSEVDVSFFAKLMSHTNFDIPFDDNIADRSFTIKKILAITYFTHATSNFTKRHLPDVHSI